MKKIIILILCTLIFLSSCNIKDPRLSGYYDLASEGGMKGIEIYAFEMDGTYKFVMLAGTNRQKFADEINVLPLANTHEMRDIVSTMSDEVKDVTFVIYVGAHPCDQASLDASFSENNEIESVIMLLLGL